MFDRVGETLTVLRVLRRWSQATLAEKAGIRATQISRYETGQVLPQLPQLERLLGALEVGLPEFLFVLLHIERTVRVMAPGEELPAETLLREAVTSHWNRVSDLHLRIARRVEEVIREEMTQTEVDTPGMSDADGARS